MISRLSHVIEIGFRQLDILFLTLESITYQNGQTHVQNLAANTARFLKCFWPFWKVIKYNSYNCNSYRRTWQKIGDPWTWDHYWCYQ